MGAQSALDFAGLLRQLRGQARLTQEELAEAAGLSPRGVSDLERGIHRTARRDTALLLADALGLAAPARALFVAAARGRGSAEDVLAACDGSSPGASHGAARLMDRCPYRGLLAFGESDAEVFYGRERLAAELAVKLASRGARGGLMVVTGASGSGKSSLLRAGLLPILARGQQVPGSDQWPRIVMTPTKDPLTELAARVAAVGGLDALAVRDGLARHPDQAHLAIRSAVLAAAARFDGEPSASGDGGGRLVLIVDQFEQVFTLNPGPGGEAARQAFITALCSAAANPAGPWQVPPALVVIAVRGDFWDRCAAVPELVGALQNGQLVVGPMTESELRVAITGPAEAAGLRIDPGLTETILGDLRMAGGDRSAGVLPLLSQAMTLTWEQRESDRLTSRGYAQAGGVSHAVQTGADRVYDALPPGQQAIARDVLRSMTVATPDGGLARRPVTRGDLYASLPGAARSDINAVLDAFAAERLVVLDEDGAQLSHDVLLRAWPRLRSWLEDDQASWIVHGQLTDAAAAWHDGGEDPSFLYRGAQLAALRQVVAQWSAHPARSPALTGTQHSFVQASERAAARSTRRRRSAFAVLCVLTVLAVAASGLAFSQRAAAVGQRDQAIYNQIAAEALQLSTSDTALAARLDLAAYRLQPTQDLASRLVNTENTPLPSPVAAEAGSVYSVAFSPHAQVMASGNADGTIRLWDVTDPAHPRPLGQPLPGGANDLYIGNASVGGPAAVLSVAFSRDGRMLASSIGRNVQLWNVTDPAHPRPLGQPPRGSYFDSTVDSVAFSPDGHTLAGGDSGNGTVWLWDITDPARPRLLGPGLAGSRAIDSVAFSPDGHTLASGGYGGAVRLWDVTDPADPRPLGEPLISGGAEVSSVAFSSDGHTLASGDRSGTIRLWDVTDPAYPRLLGPILAGGAVASVAFSPDGRTLASGSLDGTIGLWNITDPTNPSPFGQHLADGTGAVDSVAFNPDAHTLASGSLDGIIRLWSLPQTVLPGIAGGSNSVAFSPDGHTLASSGHGGLVRLWDVTDPAHPRLLGQHLAGGAAVDSVAFSADRRVLAGGDDQGAIWLWDITDPAHPRLLVSIQTGSGGVNSVAFSPDGHTLASANNDDTVRLWDVTDPAHPRPIGPILTVTDGSAAADSVAFSSDGKLLASGDYTGAVRLWNITDPAEPQPLGVAFIGGGAFAYSLAFSPGRRVLASGSSDGAVRLWDTTNPAYLLPLGQPVTSEGALVNSVAFSPDGRTLASGSFDGTVRLWDASDLADPRPLGQPLGGATAGVDSVAFSPDGRTLASGSLDGTTRLWNLDVQYAIQRICATAGGLTPRQWSQYIPQLQYQPSCGP